MNDFLKEAISEIEIRLRDTSAIGQWNSYKFIKPIDEGHYCLIVSKVGFIYYKYELEKKFKKAIKYFEKNNPEYYFFSITNIDGEKRLIM